MNLLQMYQEAQHHQHELQCQRCHRLQLQGHHHHHHQHHVVTVQPPHPDCDVIIPPPPEYVDFGLPAYDDLFPTLENVHKPEVAPPPPPTTTTTTTATAIATATPPNTLQPPTSTLMVISQTSHNLN